MRSVGLSRPAARAKAAASTSPCPGPPAAQSTAACLNRSSGSTSSTPAIVAGRVTTASARSRARNRSLVCRRASTTAATTATTAASGTTTIISSDAKYSAISGARRCPWTKPMIVSTTTALASVPITESTNSRQPNRHAARTQHRMLVRCERAKRAPVARRRSTSCAAGRESATSSTHIGVEADVTPIRSSTPRYERYVGSVVARNDAPERQSWRAVGLLLRDLGLTRTRRRGRLPGLSVAGGVALGATVIDGSDPGACRDTNPVPIHSWSVSRAAQSSRGGCEPVLSGTGTSTSVKDAAGCPSTTSRRQWGPA